MSSITGQPERAANQMGNESKDKALPAPVDAVVILPIVESCDGCGACCMAMNSPPFLGPTDPEYLELPDELRKDYDQRMDQREADGWPEPVPCFWLDQETRKCKHYEHRPDVCRHALERSDEGCHGWRKEFGFE
jgi:Fe-S-cluster containining protein